MGTSIIKNKRISDAKMIMIKDEFKIVRNKKGNPHTDKSKLNQKMMNYFWVLIVKGKLLF